MGVIASDRDLERNILTTTVDHIVAWAEWALHAIESWDDTTSGARTWSRPTPAILEAAARPRRDEAQPNRRGA